MTDSPYDQVVRTIEEWCQKHGYENMLVTLRLCTDSNFAWYTITEFLEFDGSNVEFIWLNDWWEGERYVELLGFCPLSWLRFDNAKEMLS